MDFSSETFKNILISAGGSTVLTIGVMKFLGNKIIDNLFTKKMKEFEFKINLEFDRISKINTKEFEVLPELWTNFLKVEGVLFSMSKPLQEYTDLSSLNELQLKEFFNESTLLESQKEELLNSNDINKTYTKISFIRNYNLFMKYYGELDMFIFSKFTEYKIFEKVYKILNDNLERRDALGVKIQKRLRFM